MNINEYLVSTFSSKLSAKADETEKEVHSYKVALKNTEKVLKQLAEMNIKNDRPADYLV